MSDVEELDGMWRDGLAAAAVHPAPDERARIAARVRHRRRARRTMTAGGAAALTAAAVVGVVQIGHGSTDVRVATHGTTMTTTPEAQTGPVVPNAVVQVNEAPGNQLVIFFPGRAGGDRSSVTLPSGLIRFEIHELGAGHELRIDGVPGFDAVIDKVGATITRDVRLTPGTYVMYCAIPGHRAAGEGVRLVVGN